MSNAALIASQNLNASNTAFFLCDIQEKFRPVIEHFDGPNSIVEVARRLVIQSILLIFKNNQFNWHILFKTEVSRILEIPLFVTEQVIY